MSQHHRKAAKVDRALDRLRLVARLDRAILLGQAHRLESHGLHDAATVVRRHVDDLERAVRDVDESVAQLVAVTEPGLDDTNPHVRAP